MTPSSLIWGCILKSRYERGRFGRAKLHLKGIEDFNLEHGTNRWDLQTLGSQPITPKNLRGHCSEAPGAALRFLKSSDRGDFWALSVEILVFASATGYMLTSSGFPFIKLEYIL